MVGITTKAKIKGEREVEVEVFVNSGSDYIILPTSVAEIVKPKEVGEDEFMLGDGSIVKRKIHEVELEVMDSNGKVKKLKGKCVVEERPDVLLGIEVLEKTGAILDFREKKIIFTA